ncbi:hypothetical protein CGRA01v4_13106 [Colletotrichum graminicola]|nr:hypothetical protein CGRA01v4_13106 [Colletotrichum graminicola]
MLSKGVCCLALPFSPARRVAISSLLLSAPPEHDSAEQTRSRPEETVGLFYSQTGWTALAEAVLHYVDHNAQASA